MAGERSPWFYIGIGCLVIVVLGIAALAAGGLWVFRTAKQFEADLKDPGARERRVMEVLRAERLPEGYHPVVAFTVPFLMETAILSDREPGPDGEIHGLGDRGLVYVELIRMRHDERELRDYFEGKTSDPGVLRRNDINIDVDEIISRGVIPTDEATLMYVSQRGSVSAQGMSTDGVTSVVLIDCPQDKRGRIAIWFGPDPDPGVPADRLDLSGTPADENALRQFLGHFRFCG